MGTHNVLLAHLATSLIVVLENALLALQVPMLVKDNRLAHHAQLVLSLDLLLVNALHVLKEASRLMVHLNALCVKMVPSLKVLAMQHVVNVKLDRT